MTTPTVWEVLAERLDPPVPKSRQQALLWRRDPVAFAHDAIRWPEGKELTDYQDECLDGMVTYTRQAWRGPHGLGKTTLHALGILHQWFTCELLGYDWKDVSTASAWRQLTRYLWPEVHKWSRLYDRNGLDLPLDDGKNLLDLSIKGKYGSAFAIASNDHEKLEGAHADYMRVRFDESKTIPEATWDALEGALSGQGEVGVLSTSTPGAPYGRFYSLFTKREMYQDWHVRHVTVEEAIKAGRISGEWVDDRRRQWGEESALFQNRVLGEFATSTDDAIPLAWVEAAQERWRERKEAGTLNDEITAIGADIADTGADRTCLAMKASNSILEVRYGAGKMRTADDKPDYGAGIAAAQGTLTNLMNAHAKAIAVIDALGPGASVVAGLKRAVGPKRVEPFNAMDRSIKWKSRTNEMRFLNYRAAAWWNLREMLDPHYHEELALPPDDALTEDLTVPKWLPEDAQGNTRLESKESIRERLGRSPDAGDAVAQACWAEYAQSHYGSSTANPARMRLNVPNYGGNR